MHRARFRRGLHRCGGVLDRLALLVLDVDGVLTDGGLYYGSDGEPVKRFDVRDGLGIRLLQSVGIEVALLSGGRGGATQLRARHLHIHHVLVGIKDKARAIENLASTLGVSSGRIAYVGDDYNDLVVRDHVALLIAPCDAARSLRQRADLVLPRPGGHGAVRALAEAILRRRGALEALTLHGWKDTNA
jgi:3-deoxy-D-manno-octulosonate 8-phosphate phosphatase (KDO 8-P phosphatase)